MNGSKNQPDDAYGMDVDCRHSNNSGCVGEADPHQKSHPGVNVILERQNSMYQRWFIQNIVNLVMKLIRAIDYQFHN